MTFEAEYVDAEYMDAEYARYSNAEKRPTRKRTDWAFWAALAVLALVVYTGAFLLQARPAAASTAPPNLDLHDCTLPEVKVDFARANSGEHDVIAPYAHSVCREGDVRLWEAAH